MTFLTVTRLAAKEPTQKAQTLVTMLGNIETLLQS